MPPSPPTRSMLALAQRAGDARPRSRLRDFLAGFDRRQRLLEAVLERHAEFLVARALSAHLGHRLELRGQALGFGGALFAQRVGLGPPSASVAVGLAPGPSSPRPRLRAARRLGQHAAPRRCPACRWLRPWLRSPAPRPRRPFRPRARRLRAPARRPGPGRPVRRVCHRRACAWLRPACAAAPVRPAAIVVSSPARCLAAVSAGLGQLDRP